MARSTSKNSARNNSTAQDDNERFGAFNRLLARFQRFGWDIGAVAVFAFALMTLIAIWIPKWSGGVLTRWAHFLNLWLGWGSVWIVILATIAGGWMIRQHGRLTTVKPKWGKILILEAAAFTSLALLAVLGEISLQRAELGLDGGRVGWGLAEIFRRSLEPTGLSSTIWMAFLLGLLFVILIFIGSGITQPIYSWMQRATREAIRTDAVSAKSGPVVSEAPLQGQAGASSAPEARKKRTALPPQFRKSFRVQSEKQDLKAASLPRDERLPGLDLLINEQFSRPDERNINMTAGMIEKTLADFGIPAKVVGFRVGPTVTQFAVEPGYLEKEKSGNEGDLNRQKVRVAQISGLGRDLTLALAAERLRIQAPVPGRPYVGIEVPNTRSSVVRLRPILESEVFYKISSPLAIGLGRDVSGQSVVADLASMPHLLIAGTTGSGKSVCIAALTTCLVMNNTPDDLRLVMIDPKMVELVRFNGLPHLYGKVETDLERILSVLRWTVAEMDERYKLLEGSRSRNIDTYNRKARRRRGIEPLPHIVVMIDELADLMMSAPDQTEHNLVRLAQMARATGIHLVVATQRPGTEVVTGLIKANFPARISFMVASSIDSRVILDMVGAETLLGRGDMLFLPPEASGPQRLQGVMVSDQEVERVITFWQKSRPPSDDGRTPPWEELIEQDKMLSEKDELLVKAIKIVRQEQRASASLLQRRLRVGYPRAARLVDQLEEMGVVGPAVVGGREREVWIDLEEDDDRDQSDDYT